MANYFGVAALLLNTWGAKMTKIKKFNPISVNSKLAICGVPIRVDTYKTCDFSCTYCFSNNRNIGGTKNTLENFQIGNIELLEKTLKRVFDDKIINEENILDKLLLEGITWHCGGMSDPFQRAEEKYKVTSKLIDLSNKYKIPILFSTKSNTVYGANINPELHSFQLSVTNSADDKRFEPCVPSYESRIQFYKELKSKGFRVGIRVQPFIPNVTTIDIIETFKDADHFILEGLKLVGGNRPAMDYILNTTGLKKEDFKKIGLYNLKPEIRLEMYKPFIEKFEELNMSYSIADNDLRALGNNNCCCGDKLITKATTFNSTHMIKNYGPNYPLELVKKEMKPFANCKVNRLFISNSYPKGTETLDDFYNLRFNKKRSIYSPEYQYKEE